MQDDIIEHAPLQQSVDSSADNLLDACDEHKVVADLPEVKGEKQDFVDRWERLRTAVGDVAKSTKSKQRALTEFVDSVAPVEELIIESERQLEEAAPISWDLLEMEGYIDKLNVSHLCDLQLGSCLN